MYGHTYSSHGSGCGLSDLGFAELTTALLICSRDIYARKPSAPPGSSLFRQALLPSTFLNSSPTLEQCRSIQELNNYKLGP